LWSAPMIIYIVVLSLSENTNPPSEVAINNSAAGQSDGKSSGRRGHQFLKLRFGLAAFKQSNRLLPAFNKRPGFAGNQQCRSRVEQNGVAFRAAIVVFQ